VIAARLIAPRVLFLVSSILFELAKVTRRVALCAMRRAIRMHIAARRSARAKRRGVIPAIQRFAKDHADE
jgi:hypothetical protein